MRLLVILSALIFVDLSAGPVFAQEVPRLEVEKLCDWYAVNKGAGARGSEAYNLFVNRCLKDEQSSYDTLKLIWPRLSDRSKKDCLKYTTKVEVYHYTNMRGCAFNWLPIDEAEREKASRPPAFRY